MAERRQRVFVAVGRIGPSRCGAQAEGRVMDVRMSPRQQQVLARVRAIPAGFVRTYGDISPGSPRFTGSVLSRIHDDLLPWHRVVRADGSLAKGARQRLRLEREGVPFRGERVDMRAVRLPD